MAYPWLGDIFPDLNPVPPKKPHKRARTKYDEEDDEFERKSKKKVLDDICEDTFQTLWDRFASSWDRWLEDHRHEIPDAFTIFPRRGRFTAAKTGTVCDGVRAQPRKQRSKDFFKHYGIKAASSQYSNLMYTEAWATELVLAWVHRYQLFFAIWCLPATEITY